MKKLFLLLSIFSIIIHADILINKDATKKLCETVMQSVANNQMKKGLEELRPYSIIPKSEFNVQFSQLDMQMPIITKRFGKAIGYDFINKKEIGTTLIQYIYLQKFEKHAMVWHFLFYKPKNKWLLNAWYFDDNIKGLFKD